MLIKFGVNVEIEVKINIEIEGGLEIVGIES